MPIACGLGPTTIAWRKHRSDVPRRENASSMKLALQPSAMTNSNKITGISHQLVGNRAGLSV
jgi:hypothetical protein